MKIHIWTNTQSYGIIIFEPYGKSPSSPRILTDIARIKNPTEPKDVVKNWLRSKNTIEYLSLWELLNNPTFKGDEIDPLLREAVSHSFTMSPSRWIGLTNAVGLISKTGVVEGALFSPVTLSEGCIAW